MYKHNRLSLLSVNVKECNFTNFCLLIENAQGFLGLERVIIKNYQNRMLAVRSYE